MIASKTSSSDAAKRFWSCSRSFIAWKGKTRQSKWKLLESDSVVAFTSNEDKALGDFERGAVYGVAAVAVAVAVLEGEEEDELKVRV
jgi:hypothetical protein